MSGNVNLTFDYVCAKERTRSHFAIYVWISELEGKCGDMDAIHFKNLQLPYHTY